ncbi:MAG: phosphotransferase [Lentisphaerae bacterium]|nr:phosphotransferase [Lentisphaerota bacterium]MCP4100542.1 phosphotransferase [Lentisphaerota bacterium]
MESVPEGNLNYSYKVTKDNKSIFVKLFADRLSFEKRKYRNLRQRYEMEKFVLQTCNNAGLPTPKLLASLDNYAILVQEHISGKSLMACFYNKEEPDSTLFSLGMWIGGFHNLFEIQDQKKQSLYDEYSYIQYLDIHDNTNVVKRFCGLLRGIIFTKKVLSRSDCHFGNFIISNSMLYGIDFEQCLYQPPGIDLAGIFVSFLDITEEKLADDATTEQSISMVDFRHLLDGYKEATGEDYSAIFKPYIATVLLRKYHKTGRKKFLYYLRQLDNYVS